MEATHNHTLRLQTPLGRIDTLRALISIHHKKDLRLLLEAHRRLEANKAPGIDRVNKEEYGREQQGNPSRLRAV